MVYQPIFVFMEKNRAVVAVDLGGTNIRAGIQSGGMIIEQSRVSLHAKASQEETLKQLKDLLCPLVRPGTLGIGVGVPSVVDVENGIVFNVVNIPSWIRVELKSILEEEFHVPVFVNNDVNCFVLGEHRFGNAKPFSSFVGLTLGTGLGSGIIINNELYMGANCGAGEIGYLPYLDQNLEYYCSSGFFAQHYHTTALEVYEDAGKGDKQALRIWAEFGWHLGNAIKAVAYAFDPQAVILGGSISKAYPYFEPRMKEALGDFLFPESMKKLQILQSENENIQLLGAAALVR